jgi:exonuclease III
MQAPALAALGTSLRSVGPDLARTIFSLFKQKEEALQQEHIRTRPKVLYCLKRAADGHIYRVRCYRKFWNHYNLLAYKRNLNVGDVVQVVWRNRGESFSDRATWRGIFLGNSVFYFSEGRRYPFPPTDDRVRVLGIGRLGFHLWSFGVDLQHLDYIQKRHHDIFMTSARLGRARDVVPPDFEVQPLQVDAPLEQTSLRLRAKPKSILRIATFNARTVGNDAKLHALALFAERHAIDILCVQETRLTAAKLQTDDVTCEMIGTWLRVDTPASPDGNYGVTTLVNPSLTKDFAEARILLKYRAHTLVFKEFTVHNIYLLHKGHGAERTLERETIASIDTSASHHFVLGDFNAKPQSLDMLNLCGRLSMVSAANVCGNRQCWTWRRGDTKSQIDHILVPRRFASGVRHCAFLSSNVLSDHRCVIGF